MEIQPDDRGLRLLRRAQILATLESGCRWNVAQLARKLSVSRRTIFRDIAWLRGVGCEITFDENQAMLVLAGSGGLRRLSTLTDDDWMLLGFLLQHASWHGFGDLSQRVEQLRERLWQLLPAPVVQQLRLQIEASSWRNESGATRPVGQVEVWSVISRAIERKGAVLELVVRSGGSSRSLFATPERLVMHASGWAIELREGRSGIPAVYPLSSIFSATESSATLRQDPPSAVPDA